MLKPFTFVLYSLLAGLILGIAALSLFLLHDRLSGRAALEAALFSAESGGHVDGIVKITPPLALPGFSLSNHDGGETTLQELRGRHILLTFGFTHCPDICPLTLNEFQQIQQMLGALAERAHFVFVSVDGARDSPAALKQYFDFRGFDTMLGLTGDEAAVRQLGDPLGLDFALGESDTTGSYQVTHTAGAFLLDETGHWIARYHFGAPARAIAADMRALLSA